MGVSDFEGCGTDLLELSSQWGGRATCCASCCVACGGGQQDVPWLMSALDGALRKVHVEWKDRLDLAISVWNLDVAENSWSAPSLMLHELSAAPCTPKARTRVEI